MVNTFGVRILRYLNNTSIVLHSLGVFALIVAILAKAPTHQPGSFVFSTFYDGTGTDDVGWSERASPAYVAVCGVLLTQYTITGMYLSTDLAVLLVHPVYMILESSQLAHKAMPPINQPYDLLLHSILTLLAATRI